MGFSEREQRALDSIEDGLVGSDPKLASLLAIFSRLTAGEALPAGEKIWVHSHRPHQELCWQLAGPLLWLVVSIALIAVALTVGNSGDSGACWTWAASACAG